MAPTPRWSCQHHPGVWPLFAAPSMSLHMPPTTWAHVPLLPNRWGRSRAAVQCPLLCPELGDWTRRADPRAGAQSRHRRGAGPSRSGPAGVAPDTSSRARRGTLRRRESLGKAVVVKHGFIENISCPLSDSVSCSVLAGLSAGGSSCGGYVWPGH